MTTPRLAASERPRIGLLAGWGRYPLVVAQALSRQGFQTFCLGVEGHADPELANVCDNFEWVGIARLGRGVRYFNRHQVRHVTMAGKIHKHLLFQRYVWIKHVPDLRALRCFFGHFFSNRSDRRDDTLLRAIIEDCARDGISFAPATDYAPELLVKHGQLTRCAPSVAQQNDIEFGWKLAKELGRLDVGQSVAIKGRAALAIEAIEGTDACIRRAGEHCRSGGFTVVKVAKPQQDMRFDVPTIGLGTLNTMVEAGAKCLAIEGERTIIIDEDEVIRFADQHRLAIVALSRDGQMRAPAAA
jgi:DUF1009 family protein